MALVDSIVSAESGGDSNARNPNSTASGPGQFLDSTFLDTIKSARPDLAQGKSDQDLLALKTDPEIGRQMTEAYAAQNQAILSKAGLPVTPGTTYLAHFAGPGGAVKVLQADPNASVSDILGPAVVKANPFLSGMTAQGLQAWAAKKMGVEAPQPGVQSASPASPGNGPPPQADNFDDRFGTPSILQQALTGLTNGAQSKWEQAKWMAGGMNGPQPPMYTGGPTYPLQAQDLQSYAAKHGAPAIPPQAPPIFASQNPGQQATQNPAPEAAPFMPPPAMQPIFTPPRKSIDLSGLRAMLANRAPIFPQG